MDFAKAHIKAMEYLKNGGKSDVFNLGSGVKSSVLETIKAAQEVTGQKIVVKKEEKIGLI